MEGTKVGEEQIERRIKRGKWFYEGVGKGTNIKPQRVAKSAD